MRLSVLAIMLLAGCSHPRRLSLAEYRDKLKAGWLGQIYGVSYAAPVEFAAAGSLVPDERMPKWSPKLADEAFEQDDLYCQMTFLAVAEKEGLGFTSQQAAAAFAKTNYPLWHANLAGRDNLRKGIPPPDSGHPKHNPHADDIDWQMEADWTGLISPGMPAAVVELSKKCGCIMNHGDGILGGQFIGALYSAAFFESDPRGLVEAALNALPKESGYAGMVRDLLAWSRETPGDWKKAWLKVEGKYHGPACEKGPSSIDVKLNGAYVLLGVLYSGRDPMKAVEITAQAGQDSDCNASDAGGIIATTLGYKALPKAWQKEPDPEERFLHTGYDFPALLSVSEDLAKQAVLRAGGSVTEDSLLIP